MTTILIHNRMPTTSKSRQQPRGVRVVVVQDGSILPTQVKRPVGTQRTTQGGPTLPDVGDCAGIGTEPAGV